MTTDEWKKQFEELWKDALKEGRIGVFKNCRTIRVNNTEKITESGETLDENNLPIVSVVEYKKNEYGFKDWVPYKAEYHYAWRKTDKGKLDLYFPKIKYEKENGETFTIYQESPKEFIKE